MTISVTATELPRLMRCIGSRLMPSTLPDGGQSREARDEGNAAHWLAEQMFHSVPVAAGVIAFNGHIVTDEMIEHVTNYVSAIDFGELETDTSYDGEGWQVRGRADHLAHRLGGSHALDTLTIDDFKYGWRIVSPVQNWTLLSHAIGWCIRNDTRPDRIILRIHQPRPYHPDGPLREWSCSYDELMGYYHQINQRLSNPTDELIAGIEQCAKCHARFNCRTFDESVYSAIDAMGAAFDDTLPKDVLTGELALFTQAEAMIKIAREAREELITHRINSGEVFPGWSLERRQGQRTWIAGMTGKALSIAAGVDLSKDGIVTPAEAERRGVNKAAVAALTQRPLLPSKLKRIDADARARSIFGEGVG